MTWKVPAKKDGGPQREIPPKGSHAAVCVAVVDLGHQERQKFQSADKEWVPMLYLCWELVELPSRLLVGRDFRVSLHEKAGLRHFIEQWVGGIEDGADFDLDSLVGRPCFLNILHQEKKTADGKKVYARLEGAAPPPFSKGQPIAVDDPHAKPFAFHLDDGGESSLPDWLPYLYGRSLVDWIQDSRERRGEQGEVSDEAEDELAATGTDGGDVPF